MLSGSTYFREERHDGGMYRQMNGKTYE